MKFRPYILITGIGIFLLGVLVFGLFNTWSEKSVPGRLSSILYELTLTSDREKFARMHDIFISNGKVKVLIIFNSTSQISAREKLIKNYSLVVEKRADNVLRALVPIDSLNLLSKEDIVQSVNLPDKPSKNAFIENPIYQPQK